MQLNKAGRSVDFQAFWGSLPDRCTRGLVNIQNVKTWTTENEMDRCLVIELT